MGTNLYCTRTERGWGGREVAAPPAWPAYLPVGWMLISVFLNDDHQL
jgi:hypothetical protein